MSDEKEYELIQDDCMVAGTSGPDALNEIKRYAAQYAQDGAIEVYEVTRKLIDLAAPSVASSAPELPEPFDMDMPELHIVGLSCGVEDRSIHDRYEAAEYGWRECYDAFAQVIPVIYTSDQMRAYGQACAAAERAACAKLCDELQEARFATGHVREGSAARTLAEAIRNQK